MGPEGEGAGTTLVDLALADPASARSRAEAMLEDELSGDERVRTLRAHGLACRFLGDLEGSRASLEEAISGCEPNSSLWAQCALTLGATHMYRGAVPQAQELMQAAVDCATGLQRGEALMQLGTSYIHAGHIPEALDRYRQALPILRRHGRRDWEADLLSNRGYALDSIANFGAAEKDLRKAVAIFRELDLVQGLAETEINLGRVLLARGDLAEALKMLQRGADVLVATGTNPAMAHSDRSHALLAAGFFVDARELALEAADYFHEVGNVPGFLEFAAPAAEAALSLGDTALPQMLMDRARIADGADGFPGLVARLELAALRAAQLAGTVSSDPAAVEQAGRELDRLGQRTAGLQTQLLAAEIAMRAGQFEWAGMQLGRLAGRTRRSAMATQLHRWRITAELRQLTGDGRGALRAVEAGLRVADQIEASAGSFELRIHARRDSAALAGIGTSLLFERRRIADAVYMTESVRGDALHHPPAPGAARGEMRTALRALREAEAAARLPEPPRNAESVLLNEQQKVANLSRATTGTGSQAPRARRPLRAGEVLVTFVEHDDAMQAIIGTEDRHWLGPRTPITEVVDTVEQLGFTERQLARRSRLSDRMRSGLQEQHRVLAETVDRLLLPELPDDARVILNPSPTIADLSLAALPSLWGRSHCIAPSLRVASRSLPARPRSAVVGGSSELTHVPAELQVTAEAHGVEPRVDPGPDFAAALAGADVVHLAGHFTRPGANPLFNQVELGGFALRGYDVLHLRQPPAVLVLSACSTADAKQVGGATVGFATAALAAGSAAVVVSQSLVEDGEAVVSLMGKLHRQLEAGARPADAMAAIRRSLADDDRALGGSFAVLGTGW